MNRQCFRVVFNRARGMRMVVQETAKSAGKATNVSTAGGASRAAFVLIASLTAISAAAQIVASPSAPPNQRAPILAAPNGVGVINIATPSAAGVSRNVYSDFNVPVNGVIFNNSRGSTSTQLGGWIQGNPFLATGSARVILTEVNGGNPTQIRGYMEIGGQRADLIIANPSGISVDGGGTINASRLTLTTGVPQFNASGGLESFLVRGGVVNIAGNGLDLSGTDYAGIYARALQVNAGIWAKALKVVTGANQVDADGGQSTPVAGSGAAPAFALDVAAVGGMYAGHIFLVGSEAGLGARNAGTIQTTGGAVTQYMGPGEFTITSAGRLENTGTIQTAGDANLAAQSFANAGAVRSGGALTIATQGDLANNNASVGGTLEAQRVELSSASGDLSNRQGTIRQTSAAALSINAPSLSNTNAGFIGAEPVTSSAGSSGTSTGSTGTTTGAATGGTTSTGTTSGSTSGSTSGTGISTPTTTVVVAPGSITAAGTIFNDGGAIYAGGPIALNTPNVTNAGGNLNVSTMAVSGPTFSNAGGTLNVANIFYANVGSINNAGGQLRGGGIAITTSGDLNNQAGSLLSDSDTTLNVGGDANNSAGTISAVGGLAAQVTGAVNNTSGTLVANQALNVASASLNNTQGSVQSVGGVTQLSVSGDLLNDRGRIGAGTDLSVQAGSLENLGSGSLRAGNDAAITVAGTLTHEGTITAGRNTTITAGDLNGSAAGAIGAGIEADGKLATAGDLSITTTNGLIAKGTNLAAGDASLQGASVDISASKTSGANLAITAASGNVTTSNATVTTPGTLTINADTQPTQTLFNDAGTLSANQLELHAANLQNTNSAQIVQTGTGATTIATAGTLNNTQGTIASNGQDLTLGAANFINTNGTLQHAGNGTLAISATTFSGANGTIVGNGGLVVHAGSFNQDGGTTTVKQVSIDATTLSNVGGSLIQNGAGDTRIAVTDSLANDGGTMASNGANLSIAAGGTLSNANGHLQHAGSGTFALNAGSYSGASGEIVSNGAFVGNVMGSFNQDGGTTSAKQMTLDAGSISNVGGTLTQTGSAATHIATTGNLVNDRGTIASNGSDVSVSAGGRLSNVNGHLQHAGTGTLGLTAATYSGTGGEIVSNGALVVNVTGAFTQDGGTTSAKQITLDAGSLSNVGGTVTQTGTSATHLAATGDLINDRGTLASNGSELSVSAGGTLSNANGHLQHAGTGILTLAAGSYAGTGGEIVSNGALVANVTGSFVQDGGAISANQIDISSDSLSNRDGQIIQRGAGATLHARVANALDNTNGLIGTVTGSAGAVDLKFQSIANQSGRISSDGDLTVQSTGDLRNDAGVLHAGGNLAASASGTLTNAQGAIESGGSTSSPTSSLSLQAAQIDNTEGRVANAGTGDTTLTAGTLTNSTSVTGGSRGLIAGNGALIVNASTLNNLANATLTSGGPLTLAVSDTVTNRGTIASNGALTFNQANATLDNTAGGQVTAAGDLRIAVNSLQNDAGRIATTDGSGGDLFVSANILSNRGGTLASDRDLQLTLPGSYVNDSLLHAGRDLKLSFGGDLTNTSTGTLEAVRTLRADVGGQMTNAPGGVVQAQNVDLHVAGGLNNTGEITGTTVNVVADAVSNTGNGAITGDDVTLSSRTLTNQGPQALIAATSNLALWTTDSLLNTEGATLYSLGNLQIAANSAHDVTGNLANPTNTIVNSASTIEAGGNMEIAVNALVNDRPGVSIQQVQTLDETYHMTMPSWWRNADGNNFAYNPNATNYFPYDVYYVNPADILENTTMVTPDGHIIGRAVIQTHANDTAFFTARAGRSSLYGHRERIIQSDGTMVLYYLGSTEDAPNPDQVPGVTSGVWQYEQAVQYWDAAPPAFNSAYGTCTTNCVRFFTQPDYTDPNTIMQRDTQLSLPGVASEIGREAHTIAVDDQLASGAGALGRIVAGGNIYIGFTGSVANNYSDIMAGGQLAIIGPSSGTGFTNTATTLYRRYKFDGLRLYSNGSTLAYTMPDLSLPIGSVSGVVSGGQGVIISAGSIRNIDTSAGSAANIVSQVQLTSGGTPNSGASAGAASGSGASSAGGTTVGAVNGSTAGSASGTSGAGSAGGTIAVSLVTPGAGGGAGAAIGTLPRSGLFTLAPDPSSQYLYETRPAFATYRNWLSSDYLLTNLGLDPNTTQKRLGDGFYEQQLIDQQVAQLTGRRFLSGYADDDTQYAALMTAGVTFAEQYGLRPGVTLTADQMARLTSDIVWLESQTVTLPDGSTQNVLVPKVYLAQVGPNALKPSGALITGDDVQISGDNVVNRGGTIGDSATKRAVVVVTGDIVNQGGTIQATQVGLKAGGSIRNETLTVSQSYGQQGGGVNATGSITSLSNAATIQAGNQLVIQAGTDVVDTAGRIGSGGTASITAGRDVTFHSLNTGSEYQLQIGSASLSRSSTTANVGQVTVGTDLGVSAGRDIALTGTQVTAGGNASLTAGRNVTVEAAASSQASDQRNDPTGTSYRQSRSETTVQGASVSAGNNLVVQAGTTEPGDITVTGSQLASKGLTYLNASGDVNITAARETSASDDYNNATKKGFLSSKTTTDERITSRDTAVRSSISGGTTAITAGNDINIEGAKISGTDGVLISAARALNIYEARDAKSESQTSSVTKSGFAGSIMGVPVPTGKANQDSAQSASNTAVATTIDSANGGVALQGSGSVILQGVQVDAAKDIGITGGVVSISGSMDYNSASSSHYTKQTDVGMSGLSDLGKGINAKNTDTATSQSSNLNRTTLNGANVSITATGADGKGGLLAIAGTTVNTPGALTLSADKLILGTQTTQVDQSTSSQGGDLAWQKAKGQGTSDQTTNYNQFNVGTLATSVNSVQIGLGARDSVESLSQQPGMGWIQQISNDPSLAGKVDWAKVEEAHKSWNYSQQGLTPAAAAVVTLVVAYFTAGAASGVGATAGDAAATAATGGVAAVGEGGFIAAGGLTISSAVSGAVTAGLSALAGQAAVAVINNQGDLGGALKDLGSSASVKSLVTAIATGGVLGSMNLNPTGLPTEGTGGERALTQLGQNLQAGVARALINTAINGGSLEDSLAASIKTAFLDTVAAQAANEVGTRLQPGSVENILAHALAGCAVGAARTNGDCSAGALGAAMGELSASLYDPQATNPQSDTVQFAAMMSGIAAALAGLDPNGINLASQAGANAAANNWLATQQQVQMKKEMDAATTLLDKAQVFAKWAVISGRQDLLTASGIGKGLQDAGMSDLAGLAAFLASPLDGLSGLKQLIYSPDLRQEMGDSMFAELDAKIDRMQTAITVGGDQNAEQLGRDLGNLLYQVGSVVTGATAAANGGIAVAKAAVNIGTRTLESAALQFMKLDAGAIQGFKSAEEVNALMSAADGWSPAWQAGTSVAEVTIKPGTTVKMVVTADQYAAMNKPGADLSRTFGGWATFDEVPNAAYARNELAITSDMKSSGSQLYVVDVEIVKPINAQVGAVGAQGSAAGGGNQLHFIVPPPARSSIFKYVADSGRAL